MSCCDNKDTLNEYQPRNDILVPTVKRNFKAVFLGDTSVGKSSIINVKNGGIFDDKCISTVGLNFIIIPLDNDYKLQIWDTAGQERFKSVTPSYIRGADIVIIVFSVTDSVSYGEIRNWISLSESSQFIGKFILVGNKIDDEENIQIRHDMVFENYPDYIYIETSAKTGHGIEELFEKIIATL